jgi:hypothetical protein
MTDAEPVFDAEPRRRSGLTLGDAREVGVCTDLSKSVGDNSAKA